MKAVHRKRLRKLAEYLLTQVLEERFDMSYYRSLGDNGQVCGTVGCAIGWSPAIMDQKTFKKLLSSSGTISYFDIADEYFGVTPYSHKWSYMFSAGWAHKDNTPQGAAARILYFLDHGVPDDFVESEAVELWDTSHYQDHLNKEKQ